MLYKHGQILECIDPTVVEGVFSKNKRYVLKEPREMAPNPPRFSYFINDDTGMGIFFSEGVVIEHFRAL